MPRKSKGAIRAALRKRDGDLCTACRLPMFFGAMPADGRVADDAATIDHLLKKADDGSNHLRNLSLKHSACNSMRDHNMQEARRRVMVAIIERDARRRERERRKAEREFILQLGRANPCAFGLFSDW